MFFCSIIELIFDFFTGITIVVFPKKKKNMVIVCRIHPRLIVGLIVLHIAVKTLSLSSVFGLYQ